MVRVACCFHPCGEEEASFLGLGVTSEGLVAFFGEALLTLGQEVAAVSDFLFAVGEEAAVSRGVARDVPAHLTATIESTETAARNHHVELTASHVVTDVGCHHDESLALECLVVCLGFVLAGTGEGEGKALAALAAVESRPRSARIGDLVARNYRHL